MYSCPSTCAVLVLLCLYVCVVLDHHKHSSSTYLCQQLSSAMAMLGSVRSHQSGAQSGGVCVHVLLHMLAAAVTKMSGMTVPIATYGVVATATTSEHSTDI